jgi:hypothetical protein
MQTGLKIRMQTTNNIKTATSPVQKEQSTGLAYLWQMYRHSE